MWIKNKRINILDSSIKKLINILEKSNYTQWAYLLGSKKEIIKRNILAGIARGVGVGIGITIVTAILIIVLKKIVSLNIPVIGEYIADIIEIVERSR